MNTILAADLFCGGGGTSSGLAHACKEMAVPVHLVAINHWDIAIQTHAANHPWAEHICAPIESLDPTKVVPGGRLDLLVASPECTHHSSARGGKPINDQLRASPWHVLPWLSRLYVEAVLIENVPEFQSWAPLGADGRPLKSRKGETFKAFIHAIQAHGYTVSYRVLNAADYGDATTRRRVFILARRGRDKQIHWPNPTHSQGGKVKGTKSWRTAREVIDWTLPGQSIFNRKHPLAENTMRRIYYGIQKFGGPTLQPFLIVLRGTSDAQVASSAKSVCQPIPTLSAGGNHVGVCDPFVLGQQSGSVPRSVRDPLPTIAAGGAISLIQPCLVEYYGNGSAKSVDEPMPVVTTRDHFALIQPVLDGQQLDIRFRMLQPHELSAAMGFDVGYKFTGTKREIVRQIGNAVAVNMARALCLSLLRDQPVDVVGPSVETSTWGS